MPKVIPGTEMMVTGRVGHMVFCRRGRGVYARRWVKPDDPRSNDQVAARGRFAAAIKAWKNLPDEEKKKFRERGKWIGRTGYNLFVAEHMARARAEAELGKSG